MFVESSGVIELPEIEGVVLEKICQYMHYKLKFTNTQNLQVLYPPHRHHFLAASRGKTYPSID